MQSEALFDGSGVETHTDAGCLPGGASLKTLQRLSLRRLGFESDYETVILRFWVVSGVVFLAQVFGSCSYRDQSLTN